MMYEKRYLDDDLIKWLQEKADELGRTPKCSDFNSNNKDEPSYGTYRNRFGGWNNALLAAGLNTNTHYCYYSKDGIIASLQRLAKDLGRTPVIEDLISAKLAYPMPSFPTVVRKFGSWNQALVAAGLELSFTFYTYTDAELISILQDEAKKLGKTPSRTDLDRDPNLPSSGVFAARLGSGSWNKALSKAGFSPNRPGMWRYSDEDLIDSLKEKAARLGRTPNRKDVKRDNTIPSVSTFECRFGSWNNALLAAGLPLNTRGKKA
ncbi:hypothetical protein IKF23_01665 [Candidatus Saccharibacteria bacterium]|nr:hypothetical protein [Candidatus Saccharibacteria bacterium]